MVHLRARNLKSKAILKRWLFSGEEAIFGEDFALVELEDGSEVKIKSNYNGLIAKSIKIGSHIKNGSILANIVIGDLEIEKYKKESLKKTEVKIINSQELNIKSESLNSNRTGILNSNRTESLNSNRTEEKEYVKVNTINNNVISNKNMESTIVSDFNKRDVDNSSIKSQENKEVNEIMSESNMQPKDKFAQMRLSIKESIKNAPQHKYNGDLSKEELLKITPEEVRKSDSTNLFSTDNVSGVSKFRQLVQARKEKLLEENNFKEVKDNAGEINAMSKTDEKGRPLIMRNIIQARIEKLNSAGGDTRVLKSDIVATKDNAILDHQRVENNSEQQKHLQEDNNEFKQGSDVKNQNVENTSTFKRENNVSNESYFKEKKSTLVDSNDAIDYSEATMSKDNSNKFDEENNSKSNWNYADTKISNLHDTRKRWNVIKNHDDRAAIRQRREAIEQGLTEDNLSFSKKIKEIGIPQEFLREVLYQDPESGATNYVLYNETPKGRIEFENWLRTTNLYSAYKAEKRLNEKNQGIEFDGQMNNKDLVQNEEQDSYKNRERDLYKKIHLKISENENLKTIDNELDQTMQFETVNTAEFDRDEIPEKTPKVIQKEIKTQISKKDDELVKVYDKKIADETLDFLKAEIKELHRTLKEQNQLHAATSKLNQQSNFNAGPDTFGQMMQYMLMQNMMQNMNQNKVSNRDISASDLKSVIKEEINSFANELKDKKRKEEEKILLEQEVIAKVERQFREKYERERYQEEQLHHEQKEAKRVQRKEENIRDINFEVDKPDNSVGYLQFESNDENKVIEREKVNKNRNSAVKSMILSQNFIPPLTISTEIDMSSILKLKHMLKQTQNHIKFTTISFIAKSISIALEEYPKLNSSYDPETNEVIIKKYHNIGLATETSEGLIIPVLKFVDRLSIKEVAIDIKEMTSRLRAGELLNYESEGSTITISNYGNIGAIQATPTIFYPNAAVIGVGKVVKKPVVVDNEKLAIKAIMHMSLTIDQRIIDAAEAGKFLARVKAILEKPEILTVS
ncbi:2-oxo acid dehydrogenase subunit E2 [Spiroplasma endosymbiont of Cantharis lateralis]|uniref:2-oxo acid dehydrogenase subunit E2 n=1 Tax=Spiroplasma endosymbiont of Cantharis lateralis TaxID=3066277 RepID=UPI00313AB81D